MVILMSLKGMVWGIGDVLSLMGVAGVLKLILFSAALLAQAGVTVEAVQEKQEAQETRITKLEDRQDTNELIRNVEYGALLIVGGFITWFLKQTADNTNRIAGMGSTQEHHDSAIKRIEGKLDGLIAR